MISVIVPIYNSQDHLEVAVETLLRQSFEQLQIIFVNDGSFDGSGYILQSKFDANCQFEVIDQLNQGYGAACNAGLQVAKGEYVAFFEPDDLLSESFYECLYQSARKTGADMAKYNGFYPYCFVPISLKSAYYSAHSNMKLHPDKVNLLWTSHPCIWNGIYRRQALLDNNIRFPETPGASFQDAQFQVSLYYSMKSVSIVDNAGYYYREHPGQSVNNADAKVDAVIANWDYQLKWLQDNGHKDLSYFLFNTFAQFHTLYTVRLKSKNKKRKLFRAIKSLVAKTGLKKITYKDSPPELNILFRMLSVYPVFYPVFRQLVVIAGLRHRFVAKSVKVVSWFLKKVLGVKPECEEMRRSLLFENSVRVLQPFLQEYEDSSVNSVWEKLVSSSYVGIRLKDHLALSALLPRVRLFSPDQADFLLQLPKADCVALWGQFRDERTLMLLEHAQSSGAGVVFMEEGWLRSITPTPDKEHAVDYKIPLSFVADPYGSYFDVTRPSMLEKILNSDRELTINELDYSQKCIALILEHKLSKVNHQPEILPEKLQEMISKGKKMVLVVDQAYNDWSIRKGAADQNTFYQMLEAAQNENPDALVVVKTHPDMLADKTRGGGNSLGHFDHSVESDRVLLLTDLVNPYSLIEQSEKVYVCSSQMGFESLLCGKPTVIFGAPFYAGWGVGDVRNSSTFLQRRRKKRSVEELFYFMYVEYTRYVDPTRMRPCQLHDFIDVLVKMRSSYRNECCHIKNWN